MTVWASRWFAPEEWHCKCGRTDCDAPTIPEPALISLMDNIRDDVGAPLTITSGLRCRFWNEVEGGEPNSGHLVGTEVDIGCPTSTLRFRLLTAIFHRNIRRVGIGARFIHIGLNSTPLPKDVVWTYYP